MKCIICGNEIKGYGNNPYPWGKSSMNHRCCDYCNETYVIKGRLLRSSLTAEQVGLIEVLAPWDKQHIEALYDYIQDCNYNQSGLFASDKLTEDG